MTLGTDPAVVWSASVIAVLLLGLGVRRRRSLVLWPLAVASLWFLAVRPQVRFPSTAGAREATLWTEGAVVRESGGVVLRQGGAALVGRRFPWLERAHVRGHGLRSWDWRDAGFDVASFEPPALPRGVTFAHWRRPLPHGETLFVRGAASGTPEGTEVRLVGPGGVEDRAVLAAPLASGEAAFTLRAHPRSRGPSLYAVEAGGVEAILWRETIDIEVVDFRPPAVLWLESAPSPESSAFRRWVERRGGVLGMRSRTSRDRVQITRVGGAAPVSLRPLTAAALQQFDVAVVAAGAATPSELDLLRRAVEEGRLGLLWRGREEGPGGFEIHPAPTLDTVSARLVEAGNPDAEPSELLSIPAAELALGHGQQAVLLDTAGRALAARRLAGAGWVALSLLEGTFRWPLTGHGEDHGRVWSALLDAVAPAQPAGGWRVPNGPILTDQPLALAFDGGDVSDPSGWTVEEPSGARIRIEARGDAVEPGRRHFVIWPRDAGWHRAMAGPERAWFYAADRAAWTAWQAARRHEDTRAFAAFADTETRADGVPSRPTPSRPIPRAVPFSVLLLSLTALWGRERFGLVSAAGAR